MPSQMKKVFLQAKTVSADNIFAEAKHEKPWDVRSLRAFLFSRLNKFSVMFLQKAATGENQWWRYLLTFLVVLFGIILGQLPLSYLVETRVPEYGLTQAEKLEMASSLDLRLIGIGQNLTLLLAMLAFAGGLLALWACMNFIHKKPFRLLVTPQRTVNWHKVFFGFGLWMLLSVAAELIFFAFNPGNYSFRFDMWQFLGLLAISLLILPVQTSFEELIFRGYLMQGISLLTVFRWIPLVITSVIFGLMHWMNPEVQAFGAGLTMIYYIGVGFFLGIVTLMDDSLELALGIHAATNIFGAVFVTFDDAALQTAALFRVDVVNMPAMLVAFFISAALFLVIVARKYRWKNPEKWYSKMERPQQDLADHFITD